MRLHLLILATAAVCATTAWAANSTDEIFTVVRATPMDEEQLKLLNLLFKDAHKHNLDFWKSPTGVGYTVDIMSRREKADQLQAMFKSINMPNNRTIGDVQQLILDREVRVKHEKEGLGSFAKRLRDEGVSNRAKYEFGDYHGYGEIVRWLNEIAQEYPAYTRVLSIGTTYEGRNIIAIKIGANASRSDKRVVWIDGGIHAREWGAVHTALYFIEQLIVGYENNDPQIRSYVDNLNFYIIPVLNPDGFEYTRSDVTPMKRLWRKNRAGITCSKDQWFRDRCCGGVDLNRNFDFHWGGSGSSDDPCSEIFQGASAFSEMESQAVKNMMLGPELHGKVDAFITLHTYSQMWIHPFSHAKKSVPADIAELKSVGERAVAALESMYGTKYRFGTGADILYPSSGGSDDWAKAKGGAKYVYLLELRPGEDVWDGFVLDARQLVPMGKETWEGIKVVVDAVNTRKQETLQPSQITRAQIEARRPGTTRHRVPSKHRGSSLIHRRPLSRLVTSGQPPLFRPRTDQVHAGAGAHDLTGAREVDGQSRDHRLPQPVHRGRPRLQRPRPQPVVTPPTARVFTQPSLEQRQRQQTQLLLQQQAERERQQRLQQQQRQQQQLQQQQSGIGQCRDLSPWCRAWLQQNADVCRVSSIYMSRDCRLTCRFC